MSAQACTLHSKTNSMNYPHAHGSTALSMAFQKQPLLGSTHAELFVAQLVFSGGLLEAGWSSMILPMGKLGGLTIKVFAHASCLTIFRYLNQVYNRQAITTCLGIPIH
jgi:hypothetical protein